MYKKKKKYCHVWKNLFEKIVRIYVWLFHSHVFVCVYVRLYVCGTFVTVAVYNPKVLYNKKQCMFVCMYVCMDVCIFQCIFQYMTLYYNIIMQSLNECIFTYILHIYIYFLDVPAMSVQYKKQSRQERQPHQPKPLQIFMFPKKKQHQGHQKGQQVPSNDVLHMQNKIKFT